MNHLEDLGAYGHEQVMKYQASEPLHTDTVGGKHSQQSDFYADRAVPWSHWHNDSTFSPVLIFFSFVPICPSSGKGVISCL